MWGKIEEIGVLCGADDAQGVQAGRDYDGDSDGSSAAPHSLWQYGHQPAWSRYRVILGGFSAEKSSESNNRSLFCTKGAARPVGRRATSLSRAAPTGVEEALDCKSDQDGRVDMARWEVVGRTRDDPVVKADAKELVPTVAMRAAAARIPNLMVGQPVEMTNELEESCACDQRF